MQALCLHAVTAAVVTLLFCGLWFGFGDWVFFGRLFLVAWASTTLYSVLYSLWGWVERRLIRR